MNILAITTSQPITWGDVLIVLAVIVLLGMALSFWRRR